MINKKYESTGLVHYLSQVITNQNINHHLYADDTVLYVIFTNRYTNIYVNIDILCKCKQANTNFIQIKLV